jgi:drug/metabolite transporter (DMT)-like permease
MDFPIVNALASGANFTVSSIISPRYSQVANRDRAPGQPAPAFFSVWTPIFAGQIAYGFLKPSERSDEASLWNLVIAGSGFAYAYTLVNRRFYSMQAAMTAMLIATAMYRKGLKPSRSRTSKFVKFTAEMGVGWLAAANLIVASQNIKRLKKTDFSEAEANIVGATETLALTGASLAANRAHGWAGVGAASLWALTGIVFDKRSKPSVRAMAGVAALSVVADFLNHHAKVESARVRPALPARTIIFEEVVTIEI